MPGNPEQCRLNAARCLKLAKRHANPTYHSTFTIQAPRGTRYRARLVQGERAKWQRIR